VPATATLSEADAKALVAAYGVPVAAERVAATAPEAALAAGAVGFPVVVKLCGPRITHKTERGLVRLGVRTEAEVHAAAEELLAAATADDGDVAVLVGAFVAGERELIAGLARDPQFGMTVMVGVGGVLAEAVADVSFRLVPITPLDAEEMIADLAAQPLLGPWRGQPAVDRQRLAAVLIGLSDLARDRPDVVAVDLNPLVVAAGVPVAVDALVELAP
jgi:succinyl-CoA synthetase beta subunit